MSGELTDPELVRQRAARLSGANVAPFECWREAIAGGRTVPHFDPADRGLGARMLILLETPAARGEGVRFVSRDNASGTQRNLRRFLADARISRSDTLIWNTVP